MADFNAIGNPFLAAGVPRLYGVDQPHIDMVSADIQVVTSPWERPEFWALCGGSLAVAPIEMSAGGAGNINATELRNPTGSGVLMILDELYVLNDTGAALGYNAGWRNNAGAQLSTSTGAWTNRDARRASQMSGSGALAGRVRTEVAGGAFGNDALLYRLFAGPNSMTVYRMDLIYPAGWSFMIQNNTANQKLSVIFVGRERPLPPQEVSL